MATIWKDNLGAEKTLEYRPGWDGEAHPTLLRFVVPLGMAGVTIDGLELRAAASKTMECRNITFQLEHFPAGGKKTPLFRIDYRPFSIHRNQGGGPAELRWLDIPGTHEHPFDLNYIESADRMRSGNLPIARPVDPDPESFHGLLALCGERLRITDIGMIPPPTRQATCSESDA